MGLELGTLRSRVSCLTTKPQRCPSYSHFLLRPSPRSIAWSDPSLAWIPPSPVPSHTLTSPCRSPTDSAVSWTQDVPSHGSDLLWIVHPTATIFVSRLLKWYTFCKPQVRYPCSRLLLWIQSPFFPLHIHLAIHMSSSSASLLTTNAHDCPDSLST